MDVGNNYSVLDHPNICFVYDYVGSKDEEKSQADFVSKGYVAAGDFIRAQQYVCFLFRCVCCLAFVV